MADSLQKGAYTPDSYLANTVLTSALLNNDNTLEASSFNILLQMIGDVDGEIAANASPTMINSLGRAIGSMGLINPIFPDTFTAVQALYVANGELHTAPGNKIMLDFVPSSFTSISINGGGSIHASPAPTRAQMDGTTYKWYTEAGSRYIEFYDNITTNVVVKYTPSASFTNSPFQHQGGFNIIPSLADIANGVSITPVPTGPQTATITVPANVTNIIDMSAATPSSGAKASFVKLTGNIPYKLPRFITGAFDQTVGGGFGGATVPSTAVSLFLIDDATNTVKSKVNASFTITITSNTVLTLDDGGSGVLATLAGQQVAVVFSQGEALAQTAAYVKSYVLKHDHGPNGGQQISFLDLADTRPTSMGLANLDDATVPMHVMPQTLHRGGFSTTAPNIDGNAFIGDLRLSNGPGTNTTLLSSYSPGTPLSLYLNSLSTDWATLTGGAKVGKLSSINGGNLDYALFGNGYSIFDDRVTVGPNGILDVVGLLSESTTSTAVTATHGVNFYDDAGELTGKIVSTNKTILGASVNALQLTGTFNFSMNATRRSGFRRRQLHAPSNTHGSAIYFGVDYLDSPVGVKDYGAIGWRWDTNGASVPTGKSLWIAASDSTFDGSGSYDPWDIGQIGVNITNGIYFYPNRADFGSSTAPQRASGLRLVINPDASNNSVVFRPIQNGSELGSKDFLYSDASSCWKFDDNLVVGGTLLYDRIMRVRYNAIATRGSSVRKIYTNVDQTTDISTSTYQFLCVEYIGGTVKPIDVIVYKTGGVYWYYAYNRTDYTDESVFSDSDGVIDFIFIRL